MKWGPILRGLVVFAPVALTFWWLAGRYDAGYADGKEAGAASVDRIAIDREAFNRGQAAAQATHDQMMATFLAEQSAATERAKREAAEQREQERQREDERRAALERQLQEARGTADARTRALLARVRAAEAAGADRPVCAAAGGSALPGAGEATGAAATTAGGLLLRPDREGLVRVGDEADGLALTYGRCRDWAYRNQVHDRIKEGGR